MILFENNARKCLLDMLNWNKINLVIKIKFIFWILIVSSQHSRYTLLSEHEFLKPIPDPFWYYNKNYFR